MSRKKSFIVTASIKRYFPLTQTIEEIPFEITEEVFAADENGAREYFETHHLPKDTYIAELNYTIEKGE